MWKLAGPVTDAISTARLEETLASCNVRTLSVIGRYRRLFRQLFGQDVTNIDVLGRCCVDLSVVEQNFVLLYQIVLNHIVSNSESDHRILHWVKFINVDDS